MPMKPSPLPPNPKLLDRLEHALRWVLWRFIIDLPGHPLLSGITTGLPIHGLMWLVFWIILVLTGHWK
jgi:hypothetical protein